MKVDWKDNALNLALHGKMLLLEYNGQKRALTFYYTDPSRTAKLLARELKELGADAKCISYAKTKLGELYTQLASPQNTVRNHATAIVDVTKVVEEAYDIKRGEACFYVYDADSESLEKRSTYSLNGLEIKPLVNTFVQNGLVLFPTAPEEYASEQQLFSEIRDFLNRWHEEQRYFERSFDITYIKQSWLYDAFPEVCYRRWLAPFGQGKTAALETVGSVCYRPMLLAGCDTEASLRRCFDFFRGTALIDEADFNNTTLYSDIIKTLNVGWSSMLGWYVCQDVVDPSSTVAFRVFGPKLLATRERFADFALESRMLTVRSLQNRGEVPLFRHRRFLSEAAELRNKLLMFRFKNYHRAVELANELERANLFSELYPEARDLSSRVKQLITPLALLFPQIRNILIEAAKEHQATLTALDEDMQREDEFRGAISTVLRDIVEAYEKAHNKSLMGESGEKGESPKQALLLSGVRVSYEGRGTAQVGERGFRLPLRELTLRAANIDPAGPFASRELKICGARYAKIARDRLDLKVEPASKGYRELIIPFKRANEFLEEKKGWLDEL